MKKNIFIAVVSCILIIPLTYLWNALFDAIGWIYCKEWMAYVMFGFCILVSGIVVDYSGTIMAFLWTARKTYIQKELP